MTADQLRRLAVLIERTDYEAIDRAAAYLRACADALDAEPVAWMYPDDYERMKTSETFCTVFSVKVVSPDRGSTTVQLYPLAMPAAPTPPVQQDDEALKVLLRIVEEIDGLVSESDGVYGLHLNDCPSPWDELLPEGEYERLSSLDDARALIAKRGEK